jgi:hypothetical protein
MRLRNHKYYRHYEAILAKARLWACIDCWTEEDIDRAGLRLSPFLKRMDDLIKQLEQNKELA